MPRFDIMPSPDDGDDDDDAAAATAGSSSRWILVRHQTSSPKPSLRFRAPV